LKYSKPTTTCRCLVITAAAEPKSCLALQAGAKEFHQQAIRQCGSIDPHLQYGGNAAAARGSSRPTSRAPGRNSALRATAELRQKARRLFHELADNIPEALWIRDEEKKTIQYVNLAWQKLSGRCAVTGGPDRASLSDNSPQTTSDGLPAKRRKAPGSRASSEFRIVRPDQSVRWVSCEDVPNSQSIGKGSMIVDIIEDVTHRREVQRQLVHLARHDALSLGLPNRSVFVRIVAGRSRSCRRRSTRFVVGFFCSTST